MRINVLPEAINDTKLASRFLNSGGHKLGQVLKSEVRDAIRAIQTMPRLHPPTEDGPEDRESRGYYIERF